MQIISGRVSKTALNCTPRARGTFHRKIFVSKRILFFFNPFLIWARKIRILDDNCSAGFSKQHSKCQWTFSHVFFKKSLCPINILDFEMKTFATFAKSLWLGFWNFILKVQRKILKQNFSKISIPSVFRGVGKIALYVLEEFRNFSNFFSNCEQNVFSQFFVTLSEFPEENLHKKLFKRKNWNIFWFMRHFFTLFAKFLGWVVKTAV